MPCGRFLPMRAHALTSRPMHGFPFYCGPSTPSLSIASRCSTAAPLHAVPLPFCPMPSSAAIPFLAEPHRPARLRSNSAGAILSIPLPCNAVRPVLSTTIRAMPLRSLPLLCYRSEPMHHVADQSEALRPMHCFAVRSATLPGSPLRPVRRCPRLADPLQCGHCAALQANPMPCIPMRCALRHLRHATAGQVLADDGVDPIEQWPHLWQIGVSCSKPGQFLTRTFNQLRASVGLKDGIGPAIPAA